MKNIVLPLLALGLFSCKKEKNFPDTYEALILAKKETQEKKVGKMRF